MPVEIKCAAYGTFPEESGCLRIQLKVGGKCHLRLNTRNRPQAYWNSEGKMKRTLKRELKGLEIAKREPFGISVARCEYFFIEATRWGAVCAGLCQSTWVSVGVAEAFVREGDLVLIGFEGAKCYSPCWECRRAVDRGKQRCGLTTLVVCVALWDALE